uniref:Uncharacterized protein n=1 Tax=Arion vulgaris TaxID=1028688 RepID=A0A0B6ZBM0_9EUPU
MKIGVFDKIRGKNLFRLILGSRAHQEQQLENELSELSRKQSNNKFSFVSLFCNLNFRCSIYKNYNKCRLLCVFLHKERL